MRNMTRPLVPRSLLTALVSSGAATDTNALADAELDRLAAILPHRRRS